MTENADSALILARTARRYRMEAHAELPAVSLEPQPVDVDQYNAWAPEKFELIEGYLFRPADQPEERLKLLPPELWRHALARAYGSEWAR